MKTSWIVLIGIGVAVLYGLVSHGISESWNFTLALEIGVVVALALSGFYLRPTEGEEKVEEKGVEDRCRCRVEEEEKGVENRCRVEEESSSVEHHEKKEDHHSTPTPSTYTFSAAAPAVETESPAALWERARVMVHNIIPDLAEDAEYLNLVYSAAERGHVPALAKLGDYAFRRGAFVEAYFWTKMARRRLELEDSSAAEGLKEIDDMLLNVRRGWSMAGQPTEYENVYDSFPEERGELGRAFLRLDSGAEVKSTQKYIRALAQKGNPDAALFVTSGLSRFFD